VLPTATNKPYRHKSFALVALLVRLLVPGAEHLPGKFPIRERVGDCWGSMPFMRRHGCGLSKSLLQGAALREPIAQRVEPLTKPFEVQELVRNGIELSLFPRRLTSKRKDNIGQHGIKKEDQRIQQAVVPQIVRATCSMRGPRRVCGPTATNIVRQHAAVSDPA